MYFLTVGCEFHGGSACWHPPWDWICVWPRYCDKSIQFLSVSWQICSSAYETRGPFHVSVSELTFILIPLPRLFGDGAVVLWVLWRCWLSGRKGIQPVKNWVVMKWHGSLSRARCRWFVYGPADAPATPSSLDQVKSRMIYLSGADLPRLSWIKGC